MLHGKRNHIGRLSGTRRPRRSHGKRGMEILTAAMGVFLLVSVSCGRGSKNSRAEGGDTGESGAAGEEVTLLHVSYDIAREIYRNINEAFIPHYENETGIKVNIEQSHAGSSGQVRSVIDGVPADLVSMNQFLDIQLLYDASKDRDSGALIDTDWSVDYPNDSSPYRSTMAFVVRKGNPKNIRDWSDLVRGDIEIVAPNFKTTGNGRYSYLNAWGYGLNQAADKGIAPGDDREAAAYEFVKGIYANVLVMAAGGRAATNVFVSDGLGDVLLTFESEVNLIARDLGPEDFDVVVPSYGIDAKMYVVVVDANARRHGTDEIADAYWNFVYTTRGQEIIAESYYRPYDEEVAARYADLLPEIELFDVDEVLGGWIRAKEVHFADGGTFDRISLELGRQ